MSSGLSIQCSNPTCGFGENWYEGHAIISPRVPVETLVVIAEDNARMTDQAGTEYDVLAALSEAGMLFSGALSLEPVLDRLLASALEIARGDGGSVMLLSRDRSELIVAAARGPRARAVLGMRQPAGRSIAGWALRGGEPVLLHGGARTAPVSDHPQELSSSVVVPLAVGGRLVGVLNVSRQAGSPRMTERNAHLLSVLANQSALLADYAQLATERGARSAGPDSSPGDPSTFGPERSTRVPAPSATPQLTRREREVLDLLVDGLTNKEIAERLVVEPDTVKDHVQMIIRKLRAADRTHAAVIAVRTGLVA